MSEIQQEAHGERYTAIARILHWLMAVGFIFMWGCGIAMTSLVEDDSPMEETLFALHISVGVTLLFLLVARIAVRLLVSPPPLPADFPKLDRIGAHLGHIALYILPLLIIMVGWAETDFGGHGVSWFGIEMPKIFPTMEYWRGLEVEEIAADWHEFLAWVMLFLAAVHVAAVIKHRFFDKHDILKRML